MFAMKIMIWLEKIIIILTMKRTLSAKDEDSKKARTEPLGVINVADEIMLPPNVALPPQVVQPAEAINNELPDGEAQSNYLEDIANTLNELQRLGNPVQLYFHLSV